MTAAEFKAAGLHKLSPEELAELDLWLQGYSLKLAAALTKIAAPTTADLIETYISGTFEGWDGDTIFQLDNGQIWKQSSYAYTYHYAFHPKVLIFKAPEGYKLKVEGVDGTIVVQRLK